MTNDERPEGESPAEVAAALAAAAGAEARAEETATVEIMGLLQEHVPLTLLTDLTDPVGPSSPEILAEEGLPDVAWWVSEETPGEDVPGGDPEDADPVVADSEGADPDGPDPDGPDPEAAGPA